MCLNFEKEHPPKMFGHFQSRSDEKRRIGNIKLRATRLLDCYTPILGLLHASAKDGITLEDASLVFSETPLERLRDIATTSSLPGAPELAKKIVEQYARYMTLMRQESEEELEKKLGDDVIWMKKKNETTRIGDNVARLMEILGAGKELYRFVNV